MRADEYQALAAKRMSEDALTANIAAACKTLRLLRYHTWRSIHSPAGFPDEVIVGPGGVLFRECKREGEQKRYQPTEAQQAWLDGLGAHGLDVGVWKPSDWLSGRIAKELREIAGR